MIVKSVVGTETYLWKIETQLRGPLSHFCKYSSNLGLRDSRKGPMKGSLNDGPTMDPFCIK